MTRTLVSLVLAACLAVAPTAARADLILDQEFAPDNPNTYNVIGELTRAQTFTVGMDGQLGRVEVLLDTAPRSPALVRTFLIIPTAGGVPVYGTTPLASFMITLPGNEGDGSVLGFYGADLTEFDLQVASGDVLAIVGVGASAPDTGHWWVGLFTAPPAGYLDGAFYTTHMNGRDSDETFHPMDTENRAYDYGFRTWMALDEGGPITPPSTIPEPAILALIGLGLAALGFAKRKK
jgi:hypothetical protein